MLQLNRDGSIPAYFLFAALLLLLVGCAHQQAWKKAQVANTVRAYEEYLSKFPEGEYATKARSSIEELSYKKVVRSNSANELEAFLIKYPDGPHTQEIRQKLEDIVYRTVSRKNARDDLNAFISKFPQSKHVEEAKRKVADIDFQDATKAGSIQALEQYLDRYPQTSRRNQIQDNINDLQKDRELEPLMAAAAMGDLATVKKLLTSGLNINSKKRKYPTGLSPLMAAVTHGRDVSFGILMVDFDIRGESVNGLPAPPEKKTNIDVIDFLLSSGASYKEKDAQGRSALILAVERGYILSAKRLIKAGADVNEKLSSGNPAVQLAVALGHAEMVRTLIEAGARIDSSIARTRFIEGGNRAGYEEAIKYLKQKIK